MREDQGEVPLEPSQHSQHRGDEVSGGLAVLVGAGDQMNGDLGVGVAGELDTGGFQFVAKHGKILDDPVVHHRKLAGGITVRVRIAVGGPAVGSPPGVPNPGGPAQRGRISLGEGSLQIGQPAGPAANRQPAVAVQNGNPRGVVAAVLHAAQCVDNDIPRRTMPDVRHDSTHDLSG